MKNIQVIDGATNCSYSVYQLTEDEFATVFPGPCQDIEFIDDVVTRLGNDAVHKLLTPAWQRELLKPDVIGIHGTLFYQLEYKKKFYPNKKETDIIDFQFKFEKNDTADG